MGIGLGEFILIVAILVLVFGGGKLPELGNSLGKAVRSFRRASAENDGIQVLPHHSAHDLPRTDSASSSAPTSSSSTSPGEPGAH
jgi:sec-independent protein translocase protein TatA